MRRWFLRITAGIWRNLPKAQALRSADVERFVDPNVTQDTVDAASGVGDQGEERDPAATKHAAIVFLRGWLFPPEINQIQTLIKKHGHKEWIWHLHDKDISELFPEEKKYAILLSPQFGFGMQVRNALRRAGFGEQELGVPSLDDIYIALLEDAAQEKCETQIRESNS